MAKKITIEMLLAAKEKHKFVWTWNSLNKLPQARLRRFTTSSPMTEFHVSCGCCGTFRWVLWNELRRGRTHACISCAKAPNLAEMMIVKAKVGSLYTPTEVRKMQNQRRYVLMICTCRRKVWVSWNRFQQGTANGCKSCKSSFRTHGRGHGYLQTAWADLLRRHKENVCQEWQSYTNFAAWATKLYEPGWKITRIDRKLPYSPENCDYVPLRRYTPLANCTGNTVFLPSGVSTIV